MSSKIVIKDGVFVLEMDETLLANRRVKRIFDRYRRDFDMANLKFFEGINYIQLENFIESVNKTLIKIDTNPLILSDEVQSFLNDSAYAIQEHRIAGMTIKGYDSRWQSELVQFENILSQEITRPLKRQQLQASFYLAKMKRAANFSVPGAGKTAMMYGSFAYLSAPSVNKVNKLLVVSPLNAFESWRTEYMEVFGDKRSLMFMNLKEKRYSDDSNIRLDWGIADVIVVNYESLIGKVRLLNQLIDSKTMIVFDEVHRVKNPIGQRADKALELGPQASFHYVLTGTPIPNSYTDIYNFLHLLYKNEYDSYFGWEVNELEAIDSEEVNDKLQPFFWRTNKQDLNVPVADPDQLIEVQPNSTMLELASYIWNNEPGILAIYMRLLQASTNPAMLLKNLDELDYHELGFISEEVNQISVSEALDKAEAKQARQDYYRQIGVDKLVSPKFTAGINLITKLVREGKKIMVWGMFVDTMKKIQVALQDAGIRSNLVYGGTPKEDRVGLINSFRNKTGGIDVMISNPATLGESISLHKEVHDAVYFEYNFNLTFMLQSRDRIHRLGLKPDDYTRYYYLQMDGEIARDGFIDKRVYERLKQKEQVMLSAIDGDLLLPMIEDDFLDDVKRVIV
ncbi:SNF2-related protein [Leuconostoc falkenbergense]|uniref:SNF2-related protein n=1 Tax=Leuconostoc falkenbergense TaxID=2766470 RepID=UPI003F9CF09E